jgi:hypothetical protein
MPTRTYKQLSPAQRTILCQLAKGVRAFPGKYSRSIDKLANAGLIRADLGLQCGKFPTVWHCSITNLGHGVLFPADTATISHKDPA